MGGSTCRLRAQGPCSSGQTSKSLRGPIIQEVCRITEDTGEFWVRSPDPRLAVGQPQVNEILPPLTLPPHFVSSPLCLRGRSTGHGPV